MLMVIQILLLLASSLYAQEQSDPNLLLPFTGEGPRYITGGQVEGIKDRPVVGAVSRILPHPHNPKILYIATVNGGIWKTENADAVLFSPHWTPLTDNLPSLSFSSINFDYGDNSSRTIVASVGKPSSASENGLRRGLWRTSDGGKNWEQLGGDSLNQWSFRGVAAYKNHIVGCADSFGNLFRQAGGVFSSSDNGKTFTRIEKFAAMSCTDIVVHPDLPQTFILTGPMVGVWISNNAGRTWEKTMKREEWKAFDPRDFKKDTNETDDDEDQEEELDITATNSRVAVHYAKEKLVVYVGFLDRILLSLWRGQKNDEDNWVWTILENPRILNADGDVFSTLHPEEHEHEEQEKAGGQGDLHFSIAADPDSPHIVYVGGDRQKLEYNETEDGDDEDEDSEPYNPIGAHQYSGILFRIDASAMYGDQATPITHDYANGTAPHADSRHLIFSPSGHLLEADDGGIWARTEPRSNTGRWSALHGDLAVTEAHSAALGWEGSFFTGNQDVGVSMTYGKGTKWSQLTLGDGGVLKAYTADENYLNVYCSYYGLQGFYHVMVSKVDFNNHIDLSEIKPNKTKSFDKHQVTNDSHFLYPAMLVHKTNQTLYEHTTTHPSFYQEYRLNRFAPYRLIVPITFQDFYETKDAGNTWVNHPLFPDFTNNPTRIRASVYGGYDSKGIKNKEFVILGGGVFLMMRHNSPDTDNFENVLSYPPAWLHFPEIADVAVDPNNYANVVVLTNYGEVVFSKNIGKTWSQIPSVNLAEMGTPESVTKRIVVIPTEPLSFVVTARQGIYIHQIGVHYKWHKVTGLPNANVAEAHFNPEQDTFFVTTYGRGVWSVTNARQTIQKMLDDIEQPVTLEPQPEAPAISGAIMPTTSTTGGGTTTSGADETGVVTTSAPTGPPGGTAVLPDMSSWKVVSAILFVIATCLALACIFLATRYCQNPNSNYQPMETLDDEEYYGVSADDQHSPEDVGDVISDSD